MDNSEDDECICCYGEKETMEHILTDSALNNILNLGTKGVLKFNNGIVKP